MPKKDLSKIKDPNKLADLATDFAEKKDMKSALKCYDLAIDLVKDPQQKMMLQLMKSSWVQAQNLANMRETLSLLDVAEKHIEQGEMDKAQEIITEILEMNPNDVDTWINVGIIFSKHGHYQETFKYYKRATEIDPKDSITWNYFADVLMNLGQFDNAIASNLQALVLEPNNKQYWETHIIIHNHFEQPLKTNDDLEQIRTRIKALRMMQKLPQVEIMKISFKD